MEEKYDKVQPLLFERLRNLQVDEMRLNLVQMVENSTFPALISGPMLKERKNFFKGSKAIMDPEEFTRYMTSRADYEVETESEQAEAASALLGFIDKIEKEVAEELKNLRVKTLETVLPNTLCSTFLNQLLDGELNSEEAFKSSLEIVCRKLEGYKRTKIPKEYEVLAKRIDQKIGIIKKEIEEIPKLILKSIFDDGAVNQPPNTAKNVFSASGMTQSLYNENRGLAITSKRTFMALGGNKLKEFSLENGKELSEAEFDLSGSATSGGFALNPFNGNIAVASFNKKVFLANPEKKIRRCIDTNEHPQTINTIEWVDEEHLAVGYSEGHLNLFKLNTEEQPSLVSKQKNGSGTIQSIKAIRRPGVELTFVGDVNGKLFAYNKDHSKVEWSFEKHHTGAIQIIIGVEDHDMICTASGDKSVCLFNYVTKESFKKVMLPYVPIGVYVEPKLRYLMIGAYSDQNNKKITLVHMKNMKQTELCLENMTTIGRSLVFDPSGKFLLISADGGTISKFNLSFQ